MNSRKKHGHWLWINIITKLASPSTRIYIYTMKDDLECPLIWMSTDFKLVYHYVFGPIWSVIGASLLTGCNIHHTQPLRKYGTISKHIQQTRKINVSKNMSHHHIVYNEMFPVDNCNTWYSSSPLDITRIRCASHMEGVDHMLCGLSTTHNDMQM